MQGYGYLNIYDYDVALRGTGTLALYSVQTGEVVMSGAGTLEATPSTNYGYAMLPAIAAFGGEFTGYGHGYAMLPALEGYAEGGLYTPTVTNYGLSTLPALVSTGFLHTVSPITGSSTLPVLVGKGGEGEYGEAEGMLPALQGFAYYDPSPFEAPINHLLFTLDGIVAGADLYILLDSVGTVTGAITGTPLFLREVLASYSVSGTFSTLAEYLVSLNVSLTSSGVIVSALGDAPALDASTRVWVVNMDTFAVSQYDNYGFNSFMQDEDGNYYGLADDGIYRLDGETDGDATIPTLIDFGESNLGVMGRKKCLNFHIGTSDGSTMLSLIHI